MPSSEFPGETFIRTDITEGRDPNEKLTVVLDYFRYAFVRQKAFSGLVIFDVLPSKESPEKTRFWVRMDPLESTEPVLTGYGDPPNNLKQSCPIRVTMGRDDFFYLWSGEASSPALVAALLLTGRVKVDNWLRFGDLRHFVSSFNYATPNWIAFYKGRGQMENVERLFEAQRIRARAAGKVVDEKTGDIIDTKSVETKSVVLSNQLEKKEVVSNSFASESSETSPQISLVTLIQDKNSINADLVVPTELSFKETQSLDTQKENIPIQSLIHSEMTPEKVHEKSLNHSQVEDLTLIADKIMIKEHSLVTRDDSEESRSHVDDNDEMSLFSSSSSTSLTAQNSNDNALHSELPLLSSSSSSYPLSLSSTSSSLTISSQFLSEHSQSRDTA